MLTKKNVDNIKQCSQKKTSLWTEEAVSSLQPSVQAVHLGLREGSWFIL